MSIDAQHREIVDPRPSSGRPRPALCATSVGALLCALAGMTWPAEAADTPIRDCPSCPEMLTIPASPAGFKIGSPVTEAGHNPRETLFAVSIKPFAIGRFEVSVGEYKACVAAGACRPAEWQEPGGQHNVETGSSPYYKTYGAAVTDDRQPIVGVSHDDALAYAAWLSKSTGKAYRLPSEAEWEYAARAGTTSAYWWGGEPQKDGQAMAACQGCGSKWDSRSLAPVDAFEPNPWGLYNVHGNVWEWVADYDCDDYTSGPSDGTPRATDNCARRDAPGLFVLRGGSSFYEARFARSAARLRNFAGFRNVSVGFRIAKTL
jgi:formylglycine-generating enzyme required for sulfatase activity